MDGLSIIIFIIIGIVGSVMKQQNRGKSRDGSGRHQAQNRPKQVRMPMNNTELFKARKADREAEKRFIPEPAVFSESEGIEVEDRSRTGSLDYIELSQSDEGICNEHPEHRPINERKPAIMADEKDAEMKKEEKPVFEITEEDLVRGLIVAEILGPPRAMKNRRY